MLCDGNGKHKRMPGKTVDHTAAVAAAIREQEADIAAIAHPESTVAFCNKCHVSLKYNYLYCETPKAACSTVKLTLYRAEMEDDVFDIAENRRIHVHELAPLISPMKVPGFSARLEKMFKFCFVRDPAERLLSAYLDKIVRGKPQKIPILRALGREQEIDFPVSFPEFVDIVCSQDPHRLDPHWSIQYIHNCADRIDYDVIGRCESFAADFQQILQGLGISNAYYHSARAHQTEARALAPRYLVREVRRKIETMYRLDYEHFGY